jgi:hypothetical protein
MSGIRDSTDAAQRLLGQVLHPRFPKAPFGVDPLVEIFSETGLSPDFDLKLVRRAVADLLQPLAHGKINKR